MSFPNQYISADTDSKNLMYGGVGRCECRVVCGAGGGEVWGCMVECIVEHVEEKWWWGNHCYKAEPRARDTTYTLQPRDEGEDRGVLDFEHFKFSHFGGWFWKKKIVAMK